MDGVEVRQRREALDWKPEDLAYHARVSARTVTNIEQGKHRPREGSLLLIERALLEAERKQKRKGAA